MSWQMSWGEHAAAIDFNGDRIVVKRMKQQCSQYQHPKN
jgi:hypothetical protein